MQKKVGAHVIHRDNGSALGDGNMDLISTSVLGPCAQSKSCGGRYQKKTYLVLDYSCRANSFFYGLPIPFVQEPFPITGMQPVARTHPTANAYCE
jgi:hypothetical protein